MALNKKERDRLPSTLERSPAKAQETYIHALESAEKTHGDGEAAHRIALSALKHSFEKVGDHWETKKSKGPSDRQAARSGAAARRSRSSTPSTAQTVTPQLALDAAETEPAPPTLLQDRSMRRRFSDERAGKVFVHG